MAFAAVFPGQGSQSVGMSAALAAACPEVGETYAEASAALGYDLAALAVGGPAAELDRTENTQPALLAAGVAVWRVWSNRHGTPPVAVAGHSLGEYTALVAAGALQFADALRLVHLRGQLMQSAVPRGQGAMAAILGLDVDAVAALCTAHAGAGVVAPANLNSPAQVVIAGDRGAVESVSRLAAERGAKRVIPLAVSVPSHCALMAPAAEKLAAALADIAVSAPRIPVLNNVDVAAPEDPAAVRDALVRQLTRPVRWNETVTALAQRYGVSAIAEFGPGKVLTGLVRRIDRDLTALAVSDPEGLQKALDTLGAGTP